MKKSIFISFCIASLLFISLAIYLHWIKETGWSDLVLNTLIVVGTIGAVITALWDKIFIPTENITGTYTILKIPHMPNEPSVGKNGNPVAHQCAIRLVLNNKTNRAAFFNAEYGITIKDLVTGNVNQIPPNLNINKNQEQILPPNKEVTCIFVPMLPFEIIEKDFMSDNMNVFIYTKNGNEFCLTKETPKTK
ncbi:MAG: hypothetical protein LBK26_00300 [Rickettsiales bacterium]|jgi:hypothetical protein|nr:hypothetical protein [Rickettsiales bacterium]